MEKNITNYLNAIYQNSKTALSSIDGILTKIECKDLRDEILKEEKRYKEVAEECEAFASKNGIDGLKDTPSMFAISLEIYLSFSHLGLMESEIRSFPISHCCSDGYPQFAVVPDSS